MIINNHFLLNKQQKPEALPQLAQTFSNLTSCPTITKTCNQKNCLTEIKPIQTQTQPKMSNAKCITFAEIVQGRNASVRITEDGMIYAVDLAMVVTGKDRNNAGRDIRDLKEEIFQSTKIVERSFPGRGNGRTKLITFQDAIELVMVLPGKVARETRAQFAGIIQRYMAGDETLIAEIQSNAESTAPIAELARVSLDEPTEYQLTHKRKLDQIQLEERMIEIELKRAEAHAKNLANLAAHSALYTDLCPNQIMDERGRVLLKDCILNALTNQYLLTNGQSEPTKFLTISTVAAEMGHHFDTQTLIKIGKAVKQAYLNKYDTEPPKHEQIVGGAVRPVCTYQAKDRDLIERAINQAVNA